MEIKTDNQYIVIVEPGRTPYIKQGDPLQIIRDRIGMVRDYLQISKDIALVFDDHACLPEEYQKIGKKLEYNFTWEESPWGPLKFMGPIAVVHPNSMGFDQAQAQNILSMFKKLKR